MITTDTINFIKGAGKGAIIIPVLGLFAHFLGGMDLNFTEYIQLGTQVHDDYSLKNRFECAYSFNTPDEHKYFHRTVGDWTDGEGWGQHTEIERYMASPWATYPAILMFGVINMCKCADDRKKKKYNFLSDIKSNTR